METSSTPASTPAPALSVSLVTKSGPIEGLYADEVYAYKGIPYAKAPIGDLRFAPPQDVEPWTAVRDCTQTGPLSIQKPAMAMFLDTDEQSEDCLSLNVWTPAAPNSGEKLPVYVYIHGGGFGAGSGNDKTTGGPSFARNGIVTVAVNYRLGTLGFFASEETYKQYGTTGNWGILDQIKALEWVRDNIADFGGDPSQVTIGGESAGSWSVSALILSPLAKGLFHSAIMESGTVLALHALFPHRGNLEKSIEASQQIADMFGAEDTPEGLQLLRQADPIVLDYFAPFAADQVPMHAFFMTPIFDGYVIPKDPVAALQAGDFNQVPILIGFNRDEGSLFIQSAVDEKIYKNFAARILMKDYGAFVERFPVDEQHSAAQRAQQLTAYALFSACEKVFADTLATDNKVYLYNYNFVAPDDPRTSIFGAYHSSELTYAFNSLDITGRSAPESIKMAGEFHTRLSNFIKNGDPNVGANPPTATVWPLYDPADPQVIFFDNEVTTGALPDQENLDFVARLFHWTDSAH